MQLCLVLSLINCKGTSRQEVIEKMVKVIPSSPSIHCSSPSEIQTSRPSTKTSVAPTLRGKIASFESSHRKLMGFASSSARKADATFRYAQLGTCKVEIDPTHKQRSSNSCLLRSLSNSPTPNYAMPSHTRLRILRRDLLRTSIASPKSSKSISK